MRGRLEPRLYSVDGVQCCTGIKEIVYVIRARLALVKPPQSKVLRSAAWREAWCILKAGIAVRFSVVQGNGPILQATAALCIHPDM